MRSGVYTHVTCGVFTLTSSTDKVSVQGQKLQQEELQLAMSFEASQPKHPIGD